MNEQKVILAHPAKVNGKIEPAGKELTVSFDLAAQLRSAGALATGGAVLQDAVSGSVNTTVILSPDGGELIVPGDLQELVEQVSELTEEIEALEMKVYQLSAELEEAREIDQGRVAEIDKLDAEVAELTAKLAASTSVDVSTEETAAKSAEDAPPAATKAEPKPAKAAAKAATGMAS